MGAKMGAAAGRHFSSAAFGPCPWADLAIQVSTLSYTKQKGGARSLAHKFERSTLEDYAKKQSARSLNTLVGTNSSLRQEKSRKGG